MLSNENTFEEMLRSRIARFALDIMQAEYEEDMQQAMGGMQNDMLTLVLKSAEFARGSEAQKNMQPSMN